MGARAFATLVHADWSNGPKGRWMARATADGRGWRVSGPCPVGALDLFVADLLRAADGPVLAGFDFPIGLPVGFARRTGFPDFPAALDTFGSGDWAAFYQVADRPGDIGLRRPFYPLRSGPKGTVSRRHLFDGLGFAGMADLARRCERSHQGTRAASPMFWTLGAAVVGKAALCGWRDVIAPARRRGARLWPFEGSLAELAGAAPVTLAETYPGDAVGQIGLSLKGRSKRRQADRQALGPALLAWAKARTVGLDAASAAAIEDGFGPGCGNDNGLDAVVGLFAMIAVADGERADGAPDDEDIRRWEGWILGRSG